MVHHSHETMNLNKTQYSAQSFSRSYNHSSSGVNLTPYSGIIFFGVILTPKRSLKNSFPGVKITPDLELILTS